MDTGTPELVMKRLMGVTSEALDLCLERGIITPGQHWCGIHLRWLYTLKYGAPTTRALDTTHLGGMEIRPDNAEWRAAREKEYYEAARKLAHAGYISSVINLCIFNERPKFLSLHKPLNEKAATDLLKIIDEIRSGLEMLCKHWGREAPPYK